MVSVDALRGSDLLTSTFVGRAALVVTGVLPLPLVEAFVRSIGVLGASSVFPGGVTLRTMGFLVDGDVDAFDAVDRTEDVDVVRCAGGASLLLSDTGNGGRFARAGVLTLATEGGRDLTAALDVVPVVRTLDTDTVEAADVRRAREASTGDNEVFAREAVEGGRKDGIGVL
jgi:hypothetical protein